MRKGRNEIIDKPKENTPLKFQVDSGEWFEGTYIEKEDLFFVGYRTTGKFEYRQFVVAWNYLETQKN